MKIFDAFGVEIHWIGLVWIAAWAEVYSSTTCNYGHLSCLRFRITHLKDFSLILIYRGLQ